MKKLAMTAFSFLFISISIIGQEAQKNIKTGQTGHTDQNKFRQLKDVLPTPNSRRTASGAPGYRIHTTKGRLCNEHQIRRKYKSSFWR